MSASHETFEWHLTPSGWVPGSESLDFGGGEKRPIPTDRVATFTLDEYMGSVHSRLQVSWQKDWQADAVDIRPLLQQFGEYPSKRIKERLDEFG